MKKPTASFVRLTEEVLNDTISYKPHAIFWRLWAKKVVKKGIRYVRKALQIYTLLS